ncbi:ABC transporter ATP-binding protein [Candidatus Dojkabacteria bacterium]|nr:ABC transporter ATP-binding protein [Candidatus Dojkabacteria bacterium]
MKSIIKIKNVSKTFYTKVQEIHVLKNIDFEIADEDFLIIFGKSGCGKSTLLHILLGLEVPTAGNVEFLGEYLYPNSADINNSLVNDDQRGELRKKYIGMVYQQPYWIKSLSVVENVAVPLALSGVSESKRLKTAEQLLEQLGLLEWAALSPKELSSGQQQIAALARALATDPKIIIADEPTGNLDYESGQKLIELLSELNTKHKKTVIMVTHDLEYLPYGKTVVKMFNGEILNTSIYKDEEKKKLIEKIRQQREQDQKDIIDL